MKRKELDVSVSVMKTGIGFVRDEVEGSRDPPEDWYVRKNGSDWDDLRMPLHCVEEQAYDDGLWVNALEDHLQVDGRPCQTLAGN